MTSISKKSDSIFVTDCLFTSNFISCNIPDNLWRSVLATHSIKIVADDRLLFTSPSSKPFTRFEFWFFLIYRHEFKMFIFSTTVFFAERRNRWRFVSYVLTSFKEMLWSIKFTKGSRSGLKRPAQVTNDNATNAEKRFKYEKEKRPKWIFSAKWCEGRPWLNKIWL